MIFASCVFSFPFLDVLLSFCALWQKVEANICHFDHLCASFSVSVRLHVHILSPFLFVFQLQDRHEAVVQDYLQAGYHTGVEMLPWICGRRMS